jgi:hypothetical protein
MSMLIFQRRAFYKARHQRTEPGLPEHHITCEAQERHKHHNGGEARGSLDQLEEHLYDMGVEVRPRQRPDVPAYFFFRPCRAVRPV